MIDAGFQCCDRWQLPADGRGVTAQDYHTMYLSALTIGQRLRNHPSVIDYSWSDNAPIKKQERVSLAGFARAGFDDPIISSAEYNASPILGPSGEKEGPYDWVPPDYWYDTSHSSTAPPDVDPTLTNVGGSWGFDSEESAGRHGADHGLDRTLPVPRRSGRAVAGPGVQPVPHQLRTGTHRLPVRHSVQPRQGHGGAATGTGRTWPSTWRRRRSRTTRTPGPSSKPSSTTRTTPRPRPPGTIYWMLNKGWPSLLWDLYNEDDDEAGSFFGAQKANAAVHVLYTYDTGTRDRRQPDRHDPGGPDGRVQGLQPRRHAARRPDPAAHHRRRARACSTTSCTPRSRRPPSPAGPGHRPTSSS